MLALRCSLKEKHYTTGTERYGLYICVSLVEIALQQKNHPVATDLHGVLQGRPLLCARHEHGEDEVLQLLAAGSPQAIGVLPACCTAQRHSQAVQARLQKRPEREASTQAMRCNM